jgi:hypothetical protein
VFHWQRKLLPTSPGSDSRNWLQRDCQPMEGRASDLRSYELFVGGNVPSLLGISRRHFVASINVLLDENGCGMGLTAFVLAFTSQALSGFDF